MIILKFSVFLQNFKFFSNFFQNFIETCKTDKIKLMPHIFLEIKIYVVVIMYQIKWISYYGFHISY